MIKNKLTLFSVSLLSVILFSSAVSAQIYLYDRTEEHPSVTVNLDVIDNSYDEYNTYRQQPLLFPSIKKHNTEQIVLVPDGDFDSSGKIILTPPGQSRPPQIIENVLYEDSFLLVPPTKKQVSTPRPLKRPKRALKSHKGHKYVSKKKDRTEGNKKTSLRQPKTRTAYVNRRTSAPESILPRIPTQKAEPNHNVVPQSVINSKVPDEPRLTTATPSIPKQDFVEVASKPVFKDVSSKVEIFFEQEKHTLKETEKGKLKNFIKIANSDENKFLRLLAYASAKDGNAGKARRLSLSRALAVRSYIMDQGVRSTKIEVRALGNKAKSGNFDRVDITVIKR